MSSEQRDLRVSVNNIEICYNDFGEGKNTIIFIHGFPFDKSSWELQADELKNNSRVITYDQRGFGKSTSDQARFSIDLFADDLNEFMNALQINTATICGLSMGGYVALNAFQRYPHRFERLVLADTQCVADTPEGVEKRMKTIDNIQTNGVRIFAEEFVKILFSKSTMENNRKVVDTILQVINSISEDTIVASLKALAERRETCSILSSIKIPVLILCGEEDKITPPEKSEYMHNNIVKSHLHIINNAAHLSNMEQPDIFNKLLINFIRSI
jgi:3-oxoadipate enol-lactonase